MLETHLYPHAHHTHTHAHEHIVHEHQNTVMHVRKGCHRISVFKAIANSKFTSGKCRCTVCVYVQRNVFLISCDVADELLQEMSSILSREHDDKIVRVFNDL